MSATGVQTRTEVTQVIRILAGMVTWLRTGYPHGVPQTDHLPILALLSRRLSSDEVIAVARHLVHLENPGPADIGSEILRITDRLPVPADVERVRALAGELR